MLRSKLGELPANLYALRFQRSPLLLDTLQLRLEIMRYSLRSLEVPKRLQLLFERLDAIDNTGPLLRLLTLGRLQGPKLPLSQQKLGSQLLSLLSRGLECRIVRFLSVRQLLPCRQQFDSRLFQRFVEPLRVLASR